MMDSMWSPSDCYQTRPNPIAEAPVLLVCFPLKRQQDVAVLICFCLQQVDLPASPPLLPPDSAPTKSVHVSLRDLLYLSCYRRSSPWIDSTTSICRWSSQCVPWTCCWLAWFRRSRGSWSWLGGTTVIVVEG